MENDVISQNIVDVLYLDYKLYTIAETYHKYIQSVYKKELIQKNTNLLVDQLSIKNLSDKIGRVKYDDELIFKTIYIKLSQILIQYTTKDSLICIKSNEYINRVLVSYPNTCINIFKSKEDILRYIDKLYKAFSLPFLYTLCIERIR